MEARRVLPANPSVGVVGVGNVGRAVADAFRRVCPVLTYDKQPYRGNCADLSRLFGNVNGPVFVCVPTPMVPDGGCDLSNVNEVLSAAAGTAPPRPTLVIKSTLAPGSCRTLCNVYPQLKVVYNPEFLTERNALEEFRATRTVILGGDRDPALDALYRRLLPGVEILHATHTAAEVAKYLTNVFFALKVTFANEVHSLCKSLGVDYDDAVSLATRNDSRLGRTHWDVPGPDGMYGFGGACLPKDLKGMVRTLESLGLDPSLLKAAWNANLRHRGEADWEQLKGRAVRG